MVALGGFRLRASPLPETTGGSNQTGSAFVFRVSRHMATKAKVGARAVAINAGQTVSHIHFTACAPLCGVQMTRG